MDNEKRIENLIVELNALKYYKSVIEINNGNIYCAFLLFVALIILKCNFKKWYKV